MSKNRRLFIPLPNGTPFNRLALQNYCFSAACATNMENPADYMENRRILWKIHGKNGNFMEILWKIMEEYGTACKRPERHVSPPKKRYLLKKVHFFRKICRHEQAHTANKNGGKWCKQKKVCIFLAFYLVMSKKSSNFAADLINYRKYGKTN